MAGCPQRLVSRPPAERRRRGKQSARSASGDKQSRFTAPSGRKFGTEKELSYTRGTMIYSRGGIPAPPCESPRRPRGRGDRDSRSVGPFGPEEFFYHETSKLPRLPQASAPPSARGNQGRAPWRSRSGTRTVTTRQASG